MTHAADLSQFPDNCHPERRPAVSKVNRQTQSKHPYSPATARVEVGNFRVDIRFFDEQQREFQRVPRREAADYESPARQCRMAWRTKNDSWRDITLSEKRHP